MPSWPNWSLKDIRSALSGCTLTCLACGGGGRCAPSAPGSRRRRCSDRGARETCRTRCRRGRALRRFEHEQTVHHEKRLRRSKLTPFASPRGGAQRPSGGRAGAERGQTGRAIAPFRLCPSPVSTRARTLPRGILDRRRQHLSAASVLRLHRWYRLSKHPM